VEEVERSQGGPARGSDLKYDISVTLEEAFKGLDKKISFASMVACDGCNSTGSADSGETI
jgi:molecular chaperone DnaJ